MAGAKTRRMDSTFRTPRGEATGRVGCWEMDVNGVLSVGVQHVVQVHPSVVQVAVGGPQVRRRGVAETKKEAADLLGSPERGARVAPSRRAACRVSQARSRRAWIRRGAAAGLAKALAREGGVGVHGQGAWRSMGDDVGQGAWARRGVPARASREAGRVGRWRGLPTVVVAAGLRRDAGRGGRSEAAQGRGGVAAGPCAQGRGGARRLAPAGMRGRRPAAAADDLCTGAEGRQSRTWLSCALGCSRRRLQRTKSFGRRRLRRKFGSDTI
ncbi:hypothetical protein Taro_036589 [Colocasia esculenta]|uniref:Uncharacterized protein n=1 Tax=Colocasia esculenta TaxID=4460 RepID=A0A843WGQ7_COLES|nr:hypothetical protein [Colocasia esculenta]